MDRSFSGQLLCSELLCGIVSHINPKFIQINLTAAGITTGSHFWGSRYGRGEVGEFILIEGQQNIVLGRITSVSSPDAEKNILRTETSIAKEIYATGTAQLLGCIKLDSLMITAGVDAYPRISDKVYAAPHQFVAKIPSLLDGTKSNASNKVLLQLGCIDTTIASQVSISPERLFGRHCAVLGATGGGKSWTTAKIIEECLNFSSKLILIDATGEYRGFDDKNTTINCHLTQPLHPASESIACGLPPTSFTEADFIALFEPAGKVQGPKMRAAIKSLRLANLKPELATSTGIIQKHNRTYA